MSSLPAGKQWTSHCGKQAAMRNLRRAAKEATLSGVEHERLERWLSKEPPCHYRVREARKLMVLKLVVDTAGENGLLLSGAFDAIMNRLEREQAELPQQNRYGMWGGTFA